jgi:antitoxin ParD1/3/4
MRLFTCPPTPSASVLKMTPSEYLLDLIPKDQEEQAKQGLRRLIEEGLASGPAEARSPQDHDNLQALASGEQA